MPSPRGLGPKLAQKRSTFFKRRLTRHPADKNAKGDRETQHNTTQGKDMRQQWRAPASAAAAYLASRLEQKIHVSPFMRIQDGLGSCGSTRGRKPSPTEPRPITGAYHSMHEETGVTATSNPSVRSMKSMAWIRSIPTAPVRLLEDCEPIGGYGRPCPGA